KKSFLSVGGFDMDQLPCEENLLYYRLLEKNLKLFYSPKIACHHPSKPIFFPYARKVLFYATGRGVLLAKEPNTFHPLFCIPSLFLIILIFVLILSFISKTALIILITMIALYFLLNLIQSFYLFIFFEPNILIFLVAPIATFLLHLSYGLGMLRGYISYKIDRRGTFLMPRYEIK
ncbi:MAG: hypothetical protein V1858_04240, partial [Candidatus Gottesmanbacteria bacterium]